MSLEEKEEFERKYKELEAAGITDKPSLAHKIGKYLLDKGPDFFKLLPYLAESIR